MIYPLTDRQAYLFLRYCQDKEERKNLDLICNLIKDIFEKRKAQLPNINKDTSYLLYQRRTKEYQDLLDSHWFLTKDIHRWLKLVEELSGEDISSLSKPSIIFYKDLAKIINAIII